MQVYALRHKPSGKFMPARMFRTVSRGWSHWEPTESDDYKPYDENPRIFYTLQSARNALAMWLQGVWKETSTQGSYFEPPEAWGPEPYKPKTERNREDMEIVPFDLIEKA